MVRNTNIKKNISSNVKKYRQMNGLTQAQMAEMLYLDTQYYSQLERGERSFTIEKLVMICDIFQIGIEKLITIDNTDKQENDSELILSIENQLHDLNHSQLVILEKLLSEVLPYIG